MTIEAVDSLPLQGWNTFPISAPSSGEGAQGVSKVISDVVTPTASGMATIGSIYRLCRFPSYAKIKDFVIDLGGVDTNAAATASFDINVAWSDSLYDGTQQAFTANNGLTAFTALSIPKTGQNGTTTSATAYSAPNKLFGSVTASNAGAAKNRSFYMFNGTYAAGGAGNGPNAAWAYMGPEYPMWQFFGFKNSSGQVQDPGGFFDILLYLGVAAATPASAQIRVQMEVAI